MILSAKTATSYNTVFTLQGYRPLVNRCMIMEERFMDENVD